MHTENHMICVNQITHKMNVETSRNRDKIYLFVIKLIFEIILI